MASTDPDRDSFAPRPRNRAGLRVRLWLGCLGGSLVAFVGLWWALSPLFLGESTDPATLVTRLSSAAGAGVIVGGLLALWLDRGIVSAVRRLGHALAARELPHPTGRRPWGELSDVNQLLADLLQRHRHLARRSDDLEATREEIAAAREAVEHWIRHERWESLRLEEEGMRELADILNRGLTRQSEIEEQNRAAARQIGADLQGAAEDARESASQAERGFVEASALLTTVRELQRIGGELTPAMAPRVGGVDSGARDPWRGRAAEVIQELIRASSESVESLGGGLLRVQAVADRVQMLSNRATLIALNAVMAGSAETGAEPVDELKTLAREVRDLTAQVDSLTREVEERVIAATGRMDGVRRSATERLSENAAPAESEPPPRKLPEEAERLVERLRELVHEAAATGERMSAAGERASTSAERLVRRLGNSVSDIEGLIVRLSPPDSARGGVGGEVV